MKTSLVFSVLLAATGIACGQGYVQFANTSGTRFSTNYLTQYPGMGFVPAAAAPVGSYYFALFAAPSTQNTIATYRDPTLYGWTYVAIGTNTASAGRLSGNNSDDGQAVNVPGFAAGSKADFAVAGWTGNIGTSWAEAQAWWGNGSPLGVTGWFGINPETANDIPLSSGGSYNGVFGTPVGFLHGWGLSGYWLPEPDTFSLLSLSALMFLLFRRRRRLARAVPATRTCHYE